MVRKKGRYAVIIVMRNFEAIPVGSWGTANEMSVY